MLRQPHQQVVSCLNQSDHVKLIEKHKMGCGRMLREEERAEESKEEEQAVDTSASKVLGTPKVDYSIVQD